MHRSPDSEFFVYRTIIIYEQLGSGVFVVFLVRIISKGQSLDHICQIDVK